MSRRTVRGELSVVLVILASSVLALGCSDTTGSANCSGVLSGTEIQDSHVPSATNLSNGYRTFFWIKNLDSLCVAAPEAQNRVSFEVATFGNEPPSLFLTGKVQPAVGYQPYRVDLVLTSERKYTGSISNIGLEQGSTDGRHGYAGIQLEITFLSRGGEAEDLAYANIFLANILIGWRFERLD